MSAEQNTPDYSLLTEDEIEAIQADPSADELVTMRQAEAAKDLPDEDEDDDTETSGEIDGDPVGNQDDDDQPEPDAKQEQQTPVYEATLPEDFDQQREALKTERAELKQKYKDGEIDFDEYEDARESLAEREKELDREAVKAEISRDMSAQNAQREWAKTVNNYLDESAKSGLDFRKDDAKRQELDLYVKTLAANPANADKPGEWFLQTAGLMVRAQYGLPAPKASANSKNSRKPPIDQIPQTLANVPGGDDASETSSQFDHLDKLDGLDLERALAKLSPEQRDQYLRG